MKRACRFAARPLLLAFGCLGSSFMPALAQIQPVSFEIVDAVGMPIGAVLDVEDRATMIVPLSIDGHAALLAFQLPTGLSLHDRNSTQTVFFSSGDCTGQGYTNFLGAQFFEHQAVVGPAYTFFSGSSVTPQSVAYGSRLVSRGPGCEVVAGNENDVVPVDRVRDLMPPWQEPFRLQAVAAPAALAVPAVGPGGLAVLVLLLGGLGLRALRRRTRSAS